MLTTATRRHSAWRRLAPIAATLGLLGAGLAPAGTAAAEDPPIHIGPNFLHLPAPLTVQQCLDRFKIRCYTPQILAKAHKLDKLYERGIDGRGTTIVIPIPFGSPTIRNDLNVFSDTFGIPRPDLRIMEFGNIPPYDDTDGTRIEWAAATTLVATWAHAIAPRARIVIAETDVSETVGPIGFPEVFAAEDALMRAGIGDVMAHMESTDENTFPGYSEGDYSSLLDLRGTLRRAERYKVSMVAAAGGGGRSATWPAIDPLMTAVGSHQQLLDDDSRLVAPYTTWNDGFGAASAGGLSAVFSRPAYQNSVKDVVGKHRAFPDISLDGGVDGSGWVYQTYGGVGGTGWSLYNGSGQGVAMFAGMVAMADQLAGKRLGNINPALYKIGKSCKHDPKCGITDVVLGDNAVRGRPGDQAKPGYDLPTGLGAVEGAQLIRRLAGR